MNYSTKKLYKMMTGKRIIGTLSLFTFLFVFSSVGACPYCNNTFYDELMDSRANTLTGQEMLRAIENQNSSKSNYTSNNTGSVVTAAGITQTPPPPAPGKTEFVEIISRDEGLSIPPTSYVPQNTPPTKKVSIELAEGEAYLGNGVMFKGFTTNGSIPGPTIVVEEGDIVEFTVVNKGAIPHGASIHAAYTQTSKYLGKIPAGESRTMVFKVTYPGVYMYHCAPGGHAIPMHIIFGQYGMMVVKPKKKYKLEQILNRPPDVEIFLNQHELYASGEDAINSKPMYTVFNGKIFRYVEEPIKAKPGDYVRINFLNIGPNLLSTFHIVGIIWDFVYWQGNPDVVFPGGQSVTAGPTDSWVIEFRVPPDAGAYTMLTHAVGSTDRGAIGLLVCDPAAVTPVTVMGDGPKYTEAELKDIKGKVKRTISPFEPGTPDVDPAKIFSAGTKEVVVKIIGNSFSPKVVQIAPGTKVKWINEDAFTYMDGEFAGIHNAATFGEVPEPFAGPLLGHAETFEFVFEKEGEYNYLCAPHPYMKGRILVSDADDGSGGGVSKWIVMLSIISFVILIALLLLLSSIRKRYMGSV